MIDKKLIYFILLFIVASSSCKLGHHSKEPCIGKEKIISYFHMRNWASCLDAIDKCDLLSSDTKIIEIKFYCLAATKNIPEADKYLPVLLKNPRSEFKLSLLGEYYAIKGDYNKAAFFYDSLSRLGNINLYNKVEEVAYSLYAGKIEQAKAAIALLPKLDSTGEYSCRISNLYYLLYKKENKLDSAILAINNSILLCGGEGIERAYEYKALCFAGLGKRDSVLSNFGYAMSLDLNDGENYYERGKYWLSVGDKNKSCDDFKRAVELGDTAAPRYVDLYCKGR